MGRAGLRRIFAEMVPVTLAVVGLVATTILIRAVLQSPRSRTTLPASLRQDRVGAQEVVAKPSPPNEAQEERPTPRPEPIVDSSLDEIRRLVASTEAHASAAARQDRLAAEHRSVTDRLASEAARWRSRESLVQMRATKLDRLATRLESQAGELKLERDLLAWQRDQVRRSLAAARGKADDTYAVVPYKGASGTWRQPIVLDCRNGMVELLPDGPTFGMLQISGGFGARSNALAAVVRRRAARIHELPATDGAPTVPYILFLVRPDGIRPYYEARAALEPLGIAFGYELVGQEWLIDAASVDSSSTSVRSTEPASDDPSLTVFPVTQQRPAALAGSPPVASEANRGDGRLSLDPLREEPRIGYLPDPRRPGAEEPDLDGYTEIVPGRSWDEPSPESTPTAVSSDPVRTPTRPSVTVARSAIPPTGGAESAPAGPSGPLGAPPLVPAGVAWLDLSLDCGPSGLTIEPGGYRLSQEALKSGDLLLGRLHTLARRWQTDADGTMRMPRLRFLVRPGGEQAFWLARRHTSFAGLDWPATLQTLETAPPQGFHSHGVEHP